MLERALDPLDQAPEEIGPLTVARRTARRLDPLVEVAEGSLDVPQQLAQIDHPVPQPGDLGFKLDQIDLEPFPDRGRRCLQPQVLQLPLRRLPLG
jgi:hypothetical protein